MIMKNSNFYSYYWILIYELIEFKLAAVLKVQHFQSSSDFVFIKMPRVNVLFDSIVNTSKIM